MVVSAAREIRDGEVVFVGMRLPLDRIRGGEENTCPECGRAV